MFFSRRSSEKESARKMSASSFQSPNAIPPRTSSSGLHRDTILPPLSTSASAAASASASASASSKPVLRPVPESSWLAAASPSGSGSGSGSNNTAILGPISPSAAASAAAGLPPGTAHSPLPQPLSSNPPLSHQHQNYHQHQHSHSVPSASASRSHHSHTHSRSRSRKASASNSNTNSPITTFMSQIPTAPPGPPDPARFATDDLPWGGRKTWNEDKNRIVCGPFDYLFAHPGKDFRAQVITAFNTWLEVPPESLEVITRVVGMLHTASLLIDDVEDSSLLRRGFPVAHSIFGTAQTINSANYVYFLALQELQKLKNPKVISIFAEELVHLHRGQGMDLFWRDTLTCPTEDDYLEMVGNKTGGLFRLGIKLMQAESRSLMDCIALVNIVGLIFQIRDDYMNLSSPEYSHNKGLCEDLTEGKFSFPIIHSVRSDPTNMQLLNILKQKTNDEEVKRYAVRYMEGTGSFEYSKKVVQTLVERARRMVVEVDEGRGKSGGVMMILDRLML